MMMQADGSGGAQPQMSNMQYKGPAPRGFNSLAAGRPAMRMMPGKAAMPRTPDPRERYMPTNSEPEPIPQRGGQLGGVSPAGGPMVNMMAATGGQPSPTLQAQPPQSMVDPTGGAPVASMGATAQPAQQAGSLTDPNGLDRYITADNTLRNQRLGFNVEAGSVADAAGKAFQSQLPALDQQFGHQVEGLAKSTASMGRTGSGMHDRSFQGLTDNARATREAMLGNLTFGAAEGDINRKTQVDMARQEHMRGLQSREDQLAREAMGDKSEQMRYLSAGFGGDPTGAQNAAAQTGLAGGAEYGANAGQTNQMLGQLGQAAVNPVSGLLSSIFGGKGQAPAAGGASAGGGGMNAILRMIPGLGGTR